METQKPGQSTQNNPSSKKAEASKRPEKDTKKGNSGLIVLLVISLLSNIGLGIGLFMMNGKSNEQAEQISVLTGEVTTKDAEVLEKKQELEGLRNNLERIKAERERLGLSNDSLELQINKLGGTINSLSRKVRLSKKEKADLEKMIANLNQQIIEKDQQIVMLKSENDSLSTGLNMATEEKMRLGDSLANTANALAYAAVLKAENVKVAALKENGKELSGEEVKGSRINRIKITFSLADNKAAKKDKKNFYVAFTTPKGQVFSDPNNGGGMMQLSDGQEVLYTMSKSLDFDNTNQNLSFTMLKGFNYTPGAYKVAVYSEGYKIGEGGFKVK